jgi:hypothetical protein
MKKTLFLLGMLSISLIFTSCFNAVYYNISQDVLPLEATVNGIIRHIARYNVDGTEFLVTTANNGIRYKLLNSDTHGQWNALSAESYPFEFHHYDYYGVENHVGQQILKVVADDSYLYIVTTEYINDSEEGTASPSKAHLFRLKPALKSGSTSEWNVSSSSDWKELTTGDYKDILITYKYGDYYFSAFNVFSTNSVKNEHRNAFIRSGGTTIESSLRNSSGYTNIIKPVYYKLDNGEIKSITITNKDTVNNPADGYYNKAINSAAYLGNELCFFMTEASVSNETTGKLSDVIYFANEGNIYTYSSQGEKPLQDSNGNQISAGSVPVSCFALNSDSLIAGKANYTSTASSSSGGITRIALNSDGTASISEFTTNASVQLSSAYFILTLLSKDPSLPEIENSIYGGIFFLGTGSTTAVNFANIGLWSYYKSRGNWNRE